MDSLDFLQWGLLLISCLLNLALLFERKIAQKLLDQSIKNTEEAMDGWNKCIDEHMKTAKAWAELVRKE